MTLSIDTTSRAGAGIFPPAISDLASASISKLFGEDGVKHLIKTAEPSSADGIAFLGKEIKEKLYFELTSERIVEVLVFKESEPVCIGSFTYTAEEGCREGWACYHPLNDKAWSAWVSAEVGEKIDAVEDWSCGWNSLQNFLYIQTGMKVSLLELVDCFLESAEKKAQEMLQAVRQAKNPETLKEITDKVIPHLLVIDSFFSEETAPLFSMGSVIGHHLIDARPTACATCEDGDWENAVHNTPEEMKRRIEAAQTPLLITVQDTKGLLLCRDERGQLMVIDPHNFERSPAYYAQKGVLDISVSPRGITLIAQDLSGKKTTYFRWDSTQGLEGINLEPLKALLEDLHRKPPHGVAKVSDKMSALKAATTELALAVAR